MPFVGFDLAKVVNGAVDLGTTVLFGPEAAKKNAASRAAAQAIDAANRARSVANSVIYNTASPASSADPVRAIDTPSERGILRYPKDLPDYCMSFSFYNYQRPSIAEPLKLEPMNDVVLPIPNNLVDAFNINFKGHDFKGALGALIDDLTGVVRPVGADDSIMNSDQLAQKLGGILGAGVMNTAQGDLGTATKQAFGISENPFTSVLLEGVDFKRHAFSWKLSPRSADETDVLDKALRTFKQMSLPGRTKNNAAYTYPAIVLINIYVDGQNGSKYLYKFKPCVIESVAVNYTPDGSPAFFESTKAPVSVLLGINFREIELWFNDDESLQGTGVSKHGQTALDITKDKITKIVT